MRPIDADKLKAYKCSICDTRERCEDRETVCSEIVEIDEMPTVDHRDLIVSSHWEECDYKRFEHGEIETYCNKGIYCPICRYGFKKSELKIRNFCPSCGAKMEEDNHETDKNHK